LTRGELPLWHLWEKYFHSCAAGARGVRGLDVGGCPAVPIFHAQDLTKHDLIRRLTAEFNGYVLPPNETIQGTPRFSWIMVAMMLHIYRTLDRVGAPNGCQPSWVHIASERDVPVVACPTVHLELAAHPRISRVNFADQLEHSQWVTLWAEHARQIAGTREHESMLEQYWLRRFSNGAQDIRVEIGGHDRWTHSAPDEVVIGWELIHRSDGPRASILGGLTYFAWKSRYCSTVDNRDAGAEKTTPCAYVNRQAAAAACGRCSRLRRPRWRSSRCTSATRGRARCACRSWRWAWRRRSSAGARGVRLAVRLARTKAQAVAERAHRLARDLAAAAASSALPATAHAHATADTRPASRPRMVFH
jgi:hypothetical protein